MNTTTTAALEGWGQKVGVEVKMEHWPITFYSFEFNKQNLRSEICRICPQGNVHVMS